MRLLTLLLFAVLTWLVFTLVFSKNGLQDLTVIQTDITIQEQVNVGLQKRNEEMFAEIDDLRQGLDAVEERARHELGMIKKGETFYRIIGDESAK